MTSWYKNLWLWPGDGKWDAKIKCQVFLSENRLFPTIAGEALGPLLTEGCVSSVHFESADEAQVARKGLKQMHLHFTTVRT